MKTSHRQSKNNFARWMQKIPAFFKVLGFIIFLTLIFIIIYGPQKAWWEAKSEIEGFVSPTGYAQSFIDPLLKSGPKDQPSEIQFKVGLVSDSHADAQYYPKILEKIKEEKVNFIIHLGDFVDAGSIKDLTEAKKLLDDLDIKYYTVCGNHDHNFWPVRETKNYQSVFGDLYYSFDYQNVHFTILNNSSEYTGVSPEQMEWFRSDLGGDHSQLKFVLMHIPPYHPYLSHTMQSGEVEIQNQADEILKIASDYHVSEIFSGHLHSFSRFAEPSNKIKITVVGAAGSERNPFPSYAILTVYDDETYEVESLFLTESVQ